MPYADYADIRFQEQSWQQEFRLSSPETSALGWTVGANYFHSSFRNDTTAKASPAAFNFQTQNGTQANRIKTDSASLFGEASVPLTPWLLSLIHIYWTDETGTSSIPENITTSQGTLMKKLLTALATLLVLTGTGPAAAADYPVRPVSLMVPYPAGGASDITARALQGPMTQALGGQVIVENLGGANGVLGANRVLGARDDGYYLFQGSPNELILAGLTNACLLYTSRCV